MNTKKIVVVDDEPDIEALFKQKFRKEIRAGQVEFDFVLSAEAALKYVDEEGVESISLILSDINMPGMSGLELLKQLKQSFENVKVFMITAYTDAQTQQKALAYQADDYLMKPVNFEQLKAKIFSS